ncbi:AlstR [Drosophila busckii]|uniref:AlstR n=1 Tax=Drosophila busckii TaxID=30019 RepID=A0A0M3QYT1_DROBS|nr:AlstR [Drosophila busckii]
MRSTTNLLIINLAVSDILFVIFCVPFTATDYVLPEWPFGNLWCKFVQYMIVVTCHCSVYTLVLMSFDRFLAVVHPVTSMSLRTERNATLAIMCAWITIVTSAIPVALSHSVRRYQYRGRDGTACVFSTEEEVWSLVGFQPKSAIAKRQQDSKQIAAERRQYNANMLIYRKSDYSLQLNEQVHGYLEACGVARFEEL